MELAAFLPGRARSVTVVGSTPAPLVQFGPEIGSAMRKLFESKGVQFKLQAKLVSLIGENGRVTHAVLGDGSQLVAETILVGIGVVPATAFLKDSGIEMNPQGFVKVDATMKTNVDDVYAAGDIVTFPMAALELDNVNIQHWQMAHKHGNVAGAAIAGIAKPIDTVPFFWTMVFGKSIRYTGYGGGHDDVVIHGIVDDLQFVAYYLKKGKVIAVASMGRDPVCAVFAQIFIARKPVTKADIESNPNDDWTSWLSA
uniref:Rieske domain-containing protein n=1 Tax=Plectus sambesii TaxID=2011161 RepID=A0A914VVB9_9BILA